MQVIKEYKTRAFPSFKMNDYLYKKSDNIFNFNEVYYLKKKMITYLKVT